MPINKTTQYTTNPSSIPVETSKGLQVLSESLDSRVVAVKSIDELLSLDSPRLNDGDQINVLSWHPPSFPSTRFYGGGLWFYDASRSKSDHDGGSVISLTVPSPANQSGASGREKRDNFLSGLGETDSAGTGCYVRLADYLSPYMYGAYGDGDWEFSGGTDDYASLQALFDTLILQDSESFVDANKFEQRKIVFEEGLFKTTLPVTAGIDGKYISRAEIDMTTGAILGSGLGSDFALTIHGTILSKMSLNVTSKGGNGIKINHAKDSEFPIIRASADQTYSLYTEGMIYSCQIGSVHLDQHNSGGGATWSWFGDYTYFTLSSDTFVGMVATDIGSIHSSGTDNSIRWRGLPEGSTPPSNCGSITIGACDIEGLQINPIYIEDFLYPVTFNSIYSEAGATGNWFTAINCRHIRLNDLRGPGVSADRPMRVLDCDTFIIDGCMKHHYLLTHGTIDRLSVDNAKFEMTASRLLFTGASPNYSNPQMDRIKNLSMRNPEIVSSSSGATLFSAPVVRTGEVGGGDNLITSPQGINNGFGCSIAENASYTDISPLGYRETRLQITSDSAVQRIDFPVDTSRLTKSSNKGVLVTAWKYNPVVGTEAVENSGIQNHGVYGNYYGDIILYNGLWLISAMVVDLPDSTTAVSLVWNWNTIHTLNDVFLFGGATLYLGDEVLLPT